MDAAALFSTWLGFGLAGVGALAFAEKFVPIVPSYVLLMLLGTTAMDGTALALLVIVTVAGSVGGALAWYGFGRAVGGARVARLVARFGKYVFLRPELYQRLTDAYRNNHFWVTLFGQTVPVARVYLALPAGVLRLDLLAFTVATALGALIWNMPFLSLGYMLRSSGHDVTVVGFWTAIALIAAETLILVVVRVCRSRVMQRRALVADRG
ncbi:DedA family protein [Bradyrhizobium sp. 2TAF24]|uniref:DedA family protein n=1 Tax=Bradyrhizobium sp. 2TAF24 TaxID=3233011 RepID=UPI003F937FD7